MRIGIFVIMAGRDAGGPETYEHSVIRQLAELDSENSYYVFCFNQRGAESYQIAQRNFEFRTLPFRFHRPWDPFLLSVGDFRRLFVEQCGCKRIEMLPIKGYWGFNRMRRTLLGRVGCTGANQWFNTMGSWLWFRGSALNPWLSILAER